MNTLPEWSVFVVDGLVLLTLFGCFTFGVRRGFVEHFITTLFIVIALGASYGFGFASEFVPEFPYKTLFFFAFPLLLYFILILGQKQFFATQLDKLDARDVPIWDALLGGILGLGRGLVIIIILGLSIAVPQQLIGVQLTAMSPISWQILTPLHQPLADHADYAIRSSIIEAKASAQQADGLAKLISDVAGEEFLNQILGEKPENTLERKRKQLEKNRAANEILGENQ
jgi:uncharacterized membrane protein required for colicin V production